MSELSLKIKQFESEFNSKNEGHLLRFVDLLNGEQKKILLEDLQELELDRVHKIFKQATSVEPLPAATSKLAPFPMITKLTQEKSENLKRWYELGLTKIGQGKVALLLLAGGQGTRLGFDKPKGMYDIGLPSHKSLFQIQAERLLRLQQLAAKFLCIDSCIIPWFVMTSPQTYQETVNYFTEKNFFGINSKNVIFFNQGTLPCFTLDGKIIMESKYNIAKAPDGNGGIYRALEKHGILKDMQTRGIHYIHAFGVDNCLVKVADPTFVGFCIEQNSDCAAKVVAKAYPTEPVGVIAIRDNKVQVVEYSEIDEKTATATDATGHLIFNAGNIANHFYTLDFLKNVADIYEPNLPYHVAKKKIPYIDEKGNEIKPEQVNGIKLEMFIFDVFPYAKKFVALEVLREDEFSPLKNAKGADSPATARNDINKLHLKYLQKAGAIVEILDTDKAVVEISPLVSYEGEGLERLAGRKFITPIEINQI